MIERSLEPKICEHLESFPVVALLGPRQVGKTTLALKVAEDWRRETVYLDLERDSDFNKLSDPEIFLGQQRHRLVILDEVQRKPDLFPLLRSLVDERIRSGDPVGQFLVLGSASRDLLRQTSESLAGRIAYLELAPFSFAEIKRFVQGEEGRNPSEAEIGGLWLRGGFPGSLLAGNDEQSWAWRRNFISTFLERDLPQLGRRLPAEQMQRIWSMMAYSQGDQLNLSRFAGSLGVTGRTARNYFDTLSDLYMVRQLPPWSGNSSKRLVKTPKVYLRDTGLLHQLVGIPDLETLLGNPLCGSSWEGFVIENLLDQMPDYWSASYYRSRAQAEIDLVLEGPQNACIAIEIKRALSPKPSKGFRLAFEDIGAHEGFLVTPHGDHYPINSQVQVIPFPALAENLRKRWQ